jgi:ComF family protein
MVIAELIGKRPARQSASEGDYIIPVPLFVSRLKMRGLNQSLILANMIFSTEKEKIATDLLVRIKNTAAQSGLSGAERRKNLQAAFEVRNSKLVAGKNIYLIDDVFTTGSTVNECAKTLKKCGVASVHVWTFARV